MSTAKKKKETKKRSAPKADLDDGAVAVKATKKGGDVATIRLEYGNN